MSFKILITGGSGLVGLRLSEVLTKRGHEIVHLSRKPIKTSLYKTFYWDISKGEIEQEALDGVHSIIHLAGAGIADNRWTAERKQILTSSRVDSAKLLLKILHTTGNKIDSFISASAVGIYGFDTGGILQTEERKQLGDDFLATLCKKWEASADQFDELGARVVKLRIGLVLSKQGGLLEKLVPIAKFGLGSAFGNGQQYMSWVHIDDLVNMFVNSMEKGHFSGVYNAVAPNPVTNKEFVRQLSQVLDRPYFLPSTPKFLLKIALGELASAITGGNNVSSQKIRDAGFRFQFEHLRESLQHLLAQ